MAEAPILSYRSARKLIGTLGLLLPVVLIVSAYLPGGAFKPTISGFYYSSAGSFMVGIIAALAAFLWSYIGHTQTSWRNPFPSDKFLSQVAASSGALVALVPTDPPGGFSVENCAVLACVLKDWGLTDTGVSYVHTAFGTVFFVSLGVFALVNFRRSNQAFTLGKYGRNFVFLVCGIVVFAATALMGLYFLAPSAAIALQRLIGANAIFWLESIAVWAFALAWFVKGRTAGWLGDLAMISLGRLICTLRGIGPLPPAEP